MLFAETNVAQFMLRPVKFSAFIFFAIILCQPWNLRAEEVAPVTGKIPVTTRIDRGIITFSWPVMRGKWGLFEQPFPYSGEWKPVAETLHHTNDTAVSVSLPVPTNTTLYLVKRGFRKLPPFPMLPVPPSKSGNRPPPHS